MPPKERRLRKEDWIGEIVAKNISQEDHNLANTVRDRDGFVVFNLLYLLLADLQWVGPMKLKLEEQPTTIQPQHEFTLQKDSEAYVRMAKNKLPFRHVRPDVRFQKVRLGLPSETPLLCSTDLRRRR